MRVYQGFDQVMKAKQEGNLRTEIISVDRAEIADVELGSLAPLQLILGLAGFGINRQCGRAVRADWKI